MYKNNSKLYVYQKMHHISDRQIHLIKNCIFYFMSQMTYIKLNIKKLLHATILLRLF